MPSLLDSAPRIRHLGHFPSQLLKKISSYLFSSYPSRPSAVLNVLKISFFATGMEYNALLDLVYP